MLEGIWKIINLVQTSFFDETNRDLKSGIWIYDGNNMKFGMLIGEVNHYGTLNGTGVCDAYMNNLGVAAILIRKESLRKIAIRVGLMPYPGTDRC